MRIAVEGCMHGELAKVYDTIQEIETREGYKVDLLLCCGDFQSMRNFSDLKCMAAPDKYKEIGTFYQYYSGEKVAPVLTIFVGGNHEASNYLQELPFGGWVAPNIFYLGYAGVVEVNGILIGGHSGIYKGPDYLKGRHEAPPYSQNTIRSVFHIRNVDVFRLKQLGRTPDIFLTHDWPRGIHNHGDVDELLRRKKYFYDDISNNVLGSRPAMEILQTLKPSYWFSAHLHVKFPAIYDHEDGSCTKFLALDKCLPNRQFLQVISLGADCNGVTPNIKYCPEWLAILKSTNHLVSTEWKDNHMPGPRYDGRYNFVPTSEELEEINQIFDSNLEVSKDFKINVEVYNPSQNRNLTLWNAPEPHPIMNSQTMWLCQKLDIDDPLQLLIGNDSRKDTQISISDFSASSSEVTSNSINNPEVSFNKDEIQLDDDEDDCATNTAPTIKPRPVLSLPSPKRAEDSKNGDSSSIKEINSEKEDQKDEDGIMDFVIDTEGKVEDPGPKNVLPPKILKRRNQSVYNQEDD